jgi:hypothetical protein
MFNDTSNLLTILKEIKDYILPLSEEEFFNLEKSILLEGCRDPLIAWQRKNDQLVLVDGHNRYKICKKNNITYKPEFGIRKGLRLYKRNGKME